MAKAGAGGGGSATGIQGEVVNPSSNGAESVVYLERDTSGGFGSAVVIQTFSGVGTFTWEDSLPLDGVSYYYRARVQRSGYAASSYTASSPTNGKPTTLGGPL